MRRLKDGEILSSNIQIGKAPSSDAKYKNNGHYKAIILKKHAVDSKANVSKKTVEYEIQIISGARRGEIYRGCRPLDTFGGMDNFNEIVFSPKTTVIKGEDDGDNTVPDITDASYVVVAFMNGYHSSPFIIGGWKQPNNTGHGATEADGSHVKGQFQGTFWLIDNDGVLTIDHNGTSFVLDNEGNISITTTAQMSITSTGDTTINSSSNVNITSSSNTGITVGGNANIAVTGNTTLNASLINLTGTGAVTITGASVAVAGGGEIAFTRPSVTLGSASATEAIILGNLFKSWVDNHVHSGHNVPPTTPMPSSCLSTKSKVE